MKWPFSKKTEVEVSNQALDLNDDKLYDLMTNLPGVSSSGVTVTEQSAMKFSAVYACVSTLAGCLASLPCKVYVKENGHDKEVTTRLTSLLNREPNPTMTAIVFWEAMGHSLLLSGNAYAVITRTKVGDPKALYWVPHQNVTPRLNARKTGIIYTVCGNGSTKMYGQDDMLHIPWLGWDGLKGMSPVAAAAEGIGLGLAGEKYNAHFFTNSITSDIAITYEKSMLPEARKELEEYLQERYSRIDNLRKPFIGTNGASIVNLGMSASDAQMIEARDYQVEDIARFYGVFPWMIGAMKKNTSFGAGLSEQMLAFVKITLRKLLVRYEQEVDKKLVRHPSRFCKFNLDALLRADIKTRNEAYKVAIGGNQIPGYMTQNEIRRIEGLPPHDDSKANELYRPPEGAVKLITEGNNE